MFHFKDSLAFNSIFGQQKNFHFIFSFFYATALFFVICFNGKTPNWLMAMLSTLFFHEIPKVCLTCCLFIYFFLFALKTMRQYLFFTRVLYVAKSTKKIEKDYFFLGYVQKGTLLGFLFFFFLFQKIKIRFTFVQSALQVRYVLFDVK